MRKIISVFQRNYDGDRLIRDEVVPGAEWVLAGEGVATRKYDGTCCMIRDGAIYKRYEVKPGKKPPPGFEPATDVDDNTGKQQGWVAVGGGPEDQYHLEGFKWLLDACAQAHDILRGHVGELDGTYELLGPKIQGNPEGYSSHQLLRHSIAQPLVDCPRTFDGIREYLRTRDIEGIVFHHPDGRMAKVKKKDYGLPRKPELAKV